MRNEIKFYIIEYINATVTTYTSQFSIIPRKGKFSDVSAYGTIRVQNQLSQSPDIVANLTGTDGIDGIFLHSCVDRARFNASKTLQFCPPDGIFDVHVGIFCTM